MKLALVVLITVFGLLMPISGLHVYADDTTRAVDLDPSAGEFPEGLAIDQEGNLYFGLAPTGEIRKLSTDGQVSTYATLPSPGDGFMVGLTFDDAGSLYVCMASFDPATHGIWRVSPGGGQTELFAPSETAAPKPGTELQADIFGGFTDAASDPKLRIEVSDGPV